MTPPQNQYQRNRTYRDIAYVTKQTESMVDQFEIIVKVYGIKLKRDFLRKILK